MVYAGERGQSDFMLYAVCRALQVSDLITGVTVMFGTTRTVRKIPRFRFDRIIDDYGISRAYYLTVRIGNRLFTVWGMYNGSRVRAGFYRIPCGPAWNDSTGFND